MSFLDLFRPKWKNSNASIRIEAVQELTDESILAKIALSDISSDVRLLATEKINNNDIALNQIALSDKYDKVRCLATEKISNQTILAQIALSDISSEVRHLATEKISNQAILAQIALSNKDSHVRYIATEKIVDKKTLAQIARSDNYDYSVRASVIKKIDDQKILTQIALSDDDSLVRGCATKNLTHQTVLAEIALSDDSGLVRGYATKNITNQTILAQIALSDEYYDVRCSATKKITNQTILAQIARSDEDEMVRYHATERITNQDILTQISKNEIEYKVRLTAMKKIISFSTLSDISKTDRDFYIRKEISQLLLDRLQLKNVFDEVEATGNLSKETIVVLLGFLESGGGSLETKEFFLPYLLKSSDPEVFDAIFNWLINTFHPLSQSTITLLKTFCPDYSDILIDLRTYKIKTRVTYNGNEHNSSDERLMNQATKKLCGIKTPVSSNLLHLITMRKNIYITLSIVCLHINKGYLEWKMQKEFAINELKGRGNPAYDSSLYLEPKAWQINNQ